MSKYIVESIVCDWAIYLIDNYENKELIEVCNSKANAELICEIFNADLVKDGKYTIWKDQKITDLEAKLAESDRELKLAQKLHTELFLSYEKLKDNNDQLKQQLVEKNQAIEGLQEINQSLGQTCNNDAKEIERLREQLRTANQETLHFQNKYFAEKQIAIDELEKVKELININGYGDNEGNVSWSSIEEIIDQQINDLRSK